MTAAYRVTDSASRDLLQIWRYYDEAAGEEIANGMLDRIEARFQIIGEHPYIGVARPEYGEDVRAYHPPNLPYIIFYAISGDTVRITR